MAEHHKVYLSLGSNLGDRLNNLQAAIAALSPLGFQLTKTSAMYETEPVDFLEQPWFLNCVVEGRTDIEPIALLKKLRELESTMGSKKLIARGPRLIDIDILLYGDETINSPELQVPHPRMRQRKFVLAPLAEIAPNLKHSSWHRTAAGLLENSADQSSVRRFPEEI